MKQDIIYTSNDGVIFYNPEECLKHESNDKMNSSIIHTVYLHSANWEVLEELKDKEYLSEEAKDNLKYVLSEVAVEISINRKTGKYEVLNYKET